MAFLALVTSLPAMNRVYGLTLYRAPDLLLRQPTERDSVAMTRTFSVAKLMQGTLKFTGLYCSVVWGFRLRSDFD